MVYMFEIRHVYKRHLEAFHRARLNDASMIQPENHRNIYRAV